MQKTRIALLQTAWPGDSDTLKNTYRDLVRRAVTDGAEMICLQEFSLSPYFASKIDASGFDWAEPLSGGPSDKFFGDIAAEHGVFVIGSLFEKTEAGQYFDTATIHNPQGELAHFTRKVHIPSGEGYHETHFFGGGVEYPVHDIGYMKLAVPTCYDQWFPEMARICALNGAEFIFYPTAVGSEPTDPDFDSKDAWQTVMRGHAVANGVYIAAANRIGEENGIRFYGSSFVCDPTGKIIVEASRDQTEVIIADVDPAVMTRYRNLFPLLHQRKPQTYSRIIEAFDQPVPERWRNDAQFTKDN
ncbi:MAG: hydrolase [Chloroflexi bacterium]|nr:hydrolase [Chloroflexota bacterium]